jgi:hypothetical protein
MNATLDQLYSAAFQFIKEAKIAEFHGDEARAALCLQESAVLRAQAKSIDPFYAEGDR